MSLRLIAIAGLLMLSACGFQPVYGERAAADGGNGAGSPAADVLIRPIPERLGQLVRNRLVTRLNPSGEPRDARYALQVDLTERLDRTGFRVDETATRANLQITATYSLQDLELGEVVTRGRVRSVSSANILDQPYATEVSRRGARERGATDIADRIAAGIASKLAER